MARIGFAYNEKPELSDAAVIAGDALRPEDEPPSSRRDALASRTLAAPTSDEFAEWDTGETIGAVERALASLGDVVRLEATADFPERLRAERPDIVFNMAEGMTGMNRESHVPAICEFFGIPYSGSDPFTLSLCLHKGRTKEVLSHLGVPTAPFALVSTMRECRALRTALSARRGSAGSVGRGGTTKLRLPLFVKPVHEGSSKGITERNLVRTPEELEAQVGFLLDSYAQPVLVEEYLPGAEFTCAVLGNDDDAVVLPIVGMNFGSLPEGAEPIYGFEAKWLWDRPERPLAIFECPARIDEGLRGEIERVTLRAYQAVGCRDWSRIDVRLDAAGVPNVVEVNPLPGILPDPADNSCLPKAARAAGLSYDELIQSCVLLAAERQGVTLPATLPGALRRAAAG
ncbi:MAG: ATP-grasp domain-containing protein [Gemmatimonadaceae bacterium]